MMLQKKKIKILCFFMLMIFSNAYNFPHIIWTFWDNQETLGPIEKFCLNRTKQLHKGTDYDIRFVTNKTITKWFSTQENDQLQYIVKNNKNNMSAQGFSDLLRISLLARYGGIWLDMTTILIQNLSWLDNLQSNIDVLKLNGDQPEAFYFHSFSMRKPFSQYFNGKLIYPAPFIESFFIASKPNSEFILDFLYWLKKLVLGGKEEFIEARKSLLEFAPYQNADTIDSDYDTYYTVYVAGQLAQFKKIQAVKKAQQKNKTLKLTNNYYKLWTIQTSYGPFLHYMMHPQKNFLSNGCLKPVKPFFQNQDEIEYYPKYMTKLTHWCQKNSLTQYLTNCTDKMQKRNQFLYLSSYTFGQLFIPKRYECLYKLKIHENSFLSKYFVKSQFYQQFFNQTTTYSSDQIPWICQKVDIVDLAFYVVGVLAMFFITILIQILIRKLSIASIENGLHSLFQIRMYVLNMYFTIIAFSFEFIIMICQYILFRIGNFEPFKNIPIVFIVLLFMISYFVYFKLHWVKNKKYFFCYQIMIGVCVMIQYFQLKQTLIWKPNYQESIPVYQRDASIVVSKLNIFISSLIILLLVLLKIYMIILSLFQRHFNLKAINITQNEQEKESMDSQKGFQV